MAGVSEQPGRYERSFGGLIGALALLLLVVGAFVVFRDSVREVPDNPVEPVEWRGAATYARQQADFGVAVPRRLPPGWYATSVRFERGDDQSWHLGILTDEGRYVGLEQRGDSETTMVEEFVDEEAERGDEVVIDGRSWQAWSDERDQALVREDDGVTTVVVGTVSQEQLADFVRLLR
jgi:hypothetical protein